MFFRFRFVLVGSCFYSSGLCFFVIPLFNKRVVRDVKKLGIVPQKSNIFANCPRKRLSSDSSVQDTVPYTGSDCMVFMTIWVRKYTWGGSDARLFVGYIIKVVGLGWLIPQQLRRQATAVSLGR